MPPISDGDALRLFLTLYIFVFLVSGLLFFVKPLADLIFIRWIPLEEPIKPRDLMVRLARRLFLFIIFLLALVTLPGQIPKQWDNSDFDIVRQVSVAIFYLVALWVLYVVVISKILPLVRKAQPKPTAPPPSRPSPWQARPSANQMWKIPDTYRPQSGEGGIRNKNITPTSMPQRNSGQGCLLMAVPLLALAAGMILIGLGYL